MIVCPDCGSDQICKDGRRQGRQNYVCKHCHRRFLESCHRRGYSDEVKQQCLKMYLNGLGIRAIGRVMDISHVTILNWIKSASASLPDSPEPK